MGEDEMVCDKCGAVDDYYKSDDGEQGITSYVCLKCGSVLKVEKYSTGEEVIEESEEDDAHTL